MHDNFLIIGRKPVLEAINSGEGIGQVYILYGQHGEILDKIRIAAKKRGIKCNFVPFDKFRHITNNPNAQGVAAEKSSRKFFSLREIISSSKKNKYPLIVVLDSVQDPRNVGAIIRTAECCGADGIVLTRHNSAPINETVVKTSAGATEHIKLCQAGNLAQSLKILKDEGFMIIGSSLSEKSQIYTEADYRTSVALILGNEEKGIRRLTADNCDLLIKIPLKGAIQSLNVSVSSGIILFEILRQREQL